jgi:hypothetical protein
MRKFRQADSTLLLLFGTSFDQVFGHGNSGLKGGFVLSVVS